MVQCLQPAALNASSYRRLHGALGGGVERSGFFLNHDARKPAEHDFDSADLVPTTATDVLLGV
jgi:hypothetical protein